MFSQSMLKLKEPKRQEIREQVEHYLNRKEKIKQIPMGVMTGRYDEVSRTWPPKF